MKSSRTSIVHLSSAHPRYDTRIFIKQCQSLSAEGYDVKFVVADGKGDETSEGVETVDVGRPSSRLQRMISTTTQVYRKAVELDADLYHIHDPELIPMGLILRGKGKNVIFDAHEDLPKQMLSKPYLKGWQAKLLSWFAKHFEQFGLPRLSGVVTATPQIYKKFVPVNSNTVEVNNFPILGELVDNNDAVSWNHKSRKVCYVGGISRIRGIAEIVEAMELCSDVKLVLAGQFSDSACRDEMLSMQGWKKINETGFLDREAVKAVFHESVAGVVTFLPVPNHVSSQPNKMFEYMSAGLPIIASNFPLWKEIVEGNNCGICVDPMNPKEIAEAIDYLVANPSEAQEMGNNGKRAVTEKYNWAIEERKLLDFYADLLAGK